MCSLSPRTLLMIVVAGSLTIPVRIQAAAAAKPEPPHIEYGLEAAVNWKWWVVPSNAADWGLPMAAGSSTEGGTSGVLSSEPRPTTYEIKRGDALVKIANRYGLTVDQLKAFNKLTSDIIRVGDTLKIPTLEDLKKMAPPPPPPETGRKKSAGAPKAPEQPATGQQLSLPSGRNFDTVLMQVFLDREGFATGSIDGRAGPNFEKVIELYQTAHPGLEDPFVLKEKARQSVPDPFGVYTLKAEDFRFIVSAEDITKADAAKQPTKSRTRSRKSKSSSATEPPPTYGELVAVSRLAYRNPWEFVAERFHCEEAFLRSLNSNMKGTPAVGAQFHVPNVHPFEIEKVFESAVQPAADPAKPVTAAVVGLSRLEIYRGGALIAVMPIALARPDLRGRGTWTVLDAIPGPKLVTRQETKPEGKSSSSVSSLPPAPPTGSSAPTRAATAPSTPAASVSPPPSASAPAPATTTPSSTAPPTPPSATPSATTAPPAAPSEAATAAAPPSSPPATPSPSPSESAPTSLPPSVSISPPPAPGLPPEQHLGPGPNNPVGVIWLNLAKSKAGEPLPYGLHGTSIPDRMRTLEGIGGIRLANWDVVRAARLLPGGTPLQWK